MSILHREQLTELMSRTSQACVSIIMPTYGTGRDEQQNPLRLQTLASEARAQLVSRSISQEVLDDILQPVEWLVNDEGFWTQSHDGLALFCAPGFFRSYQIPLHVTTRLVVGKRFFVHPLVQLLHANARFFVLALCPENARLFEATRYSMRELNLDIQRKAAKRSVGNQGHERRLRTATQGTLAAGWGSETGEGQGSTSDGGKRDILKYFRAVDRAVVKILGGEHAPLVLACVGYLASIYKSTNSYAGLIDEKVPGHPDIWHEDELRDRARQLASRMLNQHRATALSRFGKAFGSDRALTDIREIVLAASDGRVDTLFLANGCQTWGHVDYDLRAVHLHPDAWGRGEDLLGYAAAQTLFHNGQVFLMDAERMPMAGSVLAALLRNAAAPAWLR